MADSLTPPHDPRANRASIGLALPAAIFLAHFATVYGIAAIACRFAWPAQVAGWPLVTSIVALVTLLAIACVLLVARSAPHGNTEGAVEREYDFEARRVFVRKAAVMLAWLAAAGMLVVAFPSLLVQPCG